MGINVTKLLGANTISVVRSNGHINSVTANPVKNKGLYSSMNGLDKTYGQSPVVEDYANVGEYFGDPVLRHVAYC